MSCGLHIELDVELLSAVMLVYTSWAIRCSVRTASRAFASTSRVKSLLLLI